MDWYVTERKSILQFAQEKIGLNEWSSENNPRSDIENIPGKENIPWSCDGKDLQNIHLYLWLMKDLSWAQDWYYSEMVFGSLAVSWAFFIVLCAVMNRATDEVFVSIAIFLWIFANFWWMSAENLIYEYPDSPSYYYERAAVASDMMAAGLCWLLLFYFIVKPCKFIDCENVKALALYNSSGLPARWPIFFDSWRSYENLHIFFWLGKDFAWNNTIPSMWVIFAIPTLLMSADFVYVTFWHDFFWVSANIVWAAGEIWDPSNDYTYGLFDISSGALHSGRWYASWLIITAFIPVIAYYSLSIYSHISSISYARSTRGVGDGSVNGTYGSCSGSTFVSTVSGSGSESRMSSEECENILKNDENDWNDENGGNDNNTGYGSYGSNDGYHTCDGYDEYVSNI